MSRPGAFFAVICAAAFAGCAHRAPEGFATRGFDHKTDTFAFANETVWSYADGRPVSRLASGRGAKPDRYTRRCFAMSRAAIQFWKFAQFDPDQPAPDRKELASRIRQVVKRPAWREPAPEPDRVVIPGFASLRDLSGRHPGLVQSLIGAGWTAYVRPANVCLVFPTPEAQRRRVSCFLDVSLARQHPVALWLHNFPRVNMNHCLVAVGRHEGEGATVYTLYDPNYTDGPRFLAFDHRSGNFTMEPTFYFPGGRVKVRTAFQNPLQ